MNGQRDPRSTPKLRAWQTYLNNKTFSPSFRRHMAQQLPPNWGAFLTSPLPGSFLRLHPVLDGRRLNPPPGGCPFLGWPAPSPLGWGEPCWSAPYPPPKKKKETKSRKFC